MVGGHVVVLAALLAKPEPPPFSLRVIVADVHPEGRLDAGERVEADGDERPVASPMRLGRFADPAHTSSCPVSMTGLVEELPGLVLVEDRRLALLHDVLRAAHGLGRIQLDDLADDQPVKEGVPVGSEQKVTLSPRSLCQAVQQDRVRISGFL